MRLAVNVSGQDAAQMARAAERLGYAVVFVPEGVRGDAVSVLGLVAGATSTIDVAGGVLEIPARTPVLTALTAATLDGLSGGRFRLGLGVANAYISEGWHGVPFERPLARTREYVAIVRAALHGEPVHHHGPHHRLPLPTPLAGPFRLPVPPVAEIPIYLAAVGPRSLELAGEIADGWFGVFCSPERVAWSLERVRAGIARRGGAAVRFDTAVSVPLVVDDDPAAAARPVRHYIARFVSLGPPAGNFYHALLCSAGYAGAAADIVARQRAGDAEGAAAAVPAVFVERTALVGTADRVAARLLAYRDAGVETLAVSPLAADPARRLADLAVAARALADLADPADPAPAPRNPPPPRHDRRDSAAV